MSERQLYWSFIALSVTRWTLLICVLIFLYYDLGENLSWLVLRIPELFSLLNESLFWTILGKKDVKSYLVLQLFIQLCLLVAESLVIILWVGLPIVIDFLSVAHYIASWLLVIVTVLVTVWMLISVSKNPIDHPSTYAQPVTSQQWITLWMVITTVGVVMTLFLSPLGGLSLLWFLHLPHVLPAILTWENHPSMEEAIGQREARVIKVGLMTMTVSGVAILVMTVFYVQLCLHPEDPGPFFPHITTCYINLYKPGKSTPVLDAAAVFLILHIQYTFLEGVRSLFLAESAHARIKSAKQRDFETSVRRTYRQQRIEKSPAEPTPEPYIPIRQQQQQRPRPIAMSSYSNVQANAAGFVI